MILVRERVVPRRIHIGRRARVRCQVERRDKAVLRSGATYYLRGEPPRQREEDQGNGIPVARSMLPCRRLHDIREKLWTTIFRKPRPASPGVTQCVVANCGRCYTSDQ